MVGQRGEATRNPGSGALSDLRNPKLKLAFGLKSLKGIDPKGHLLIEGLRLNTGAWTAKLPFIQMLYAPEFFSDHRCGELVDDVRSSGAETIRISRRVFGKYSYKAEGILGVVRHSPPSLEEIRLGISPRVVVLDGLADPGNIGGIIRSANAFGVDLVIVAESQRKLFHPKSLRASMGSLFHTPTCETDRDSALELVSSLTVPKIVMSPEGSESIRDLSFEDGYVLIVGNEKYGVHQKWRHAASRLASISMCGMVDSLNVTTSASIVMWEARRE